MAKKDNFFKLDEDLETTKADEDLRHKLTDLYTTNIDNQLLNEEQQEFIANKLGDKLWRLNNLYKIRDKDGVLITMKLNNSQVKVLTQYRHTKKIILKSRQQGISTLFLAVNLDSCIFKPGYSAGIQSYGLDESNKLQLRALLMWEELDEDIKKLLNVKLVSNNQKGMMFSNGSILKIGNFRGDTLQSLHVSELAKISSKYPEKAKELKTGAFQAIGQRNKITIESTAEGKVGLFYEMWCRAEYLKTIGAELSPFDFQAIFLSWIEDADCNIATPRAIPDELHTYFAKLEKELNIELTDTQKWWYAAKLEELGEDMKQEYPATPKEAFEQSIDGMYYKNEYKNLKIESHTYDKNLLVYGACDLGMNDTFSFGFFQIRSDGTPVVIAEYENSGQGLKYYADVIAAMGRRYNWEYKGTYVPHDTKVRELISAKTRWQAMQDLGFNPMLVQIHKLPDGIEGTRQFLRRCIIDSSCERILTAIQSYRKKFDRNLGVFLDAPVHDEFSHTADMLRYMAMGLRNKPVTEIYRYRPHNSYFDNTALSSSGYDI